MRVNAFESTCQKGTSLYLVMVKLHFGSLKVYPSSIEHSPEEAWETTGKQPGDPEIEWKGPSKRHWRAVAAILRSTVMWWSGRCYSQRKAVHRMKEQQPRVYWNLHRRNKHNLIHLHIFIVTFHWTRLTLISRRHSKAPSEGKLTEGIVTGSWSVTSSNTTWE